MAGEFADSVYGPISIAFAQSALGDLCVSDGGVQTGPFGSQLHASDYVEEGTPIITVEHLGENRIIHTDLPRVADEDKERLSKYTLRVGDIVFSRVGAVDRRAIVHPEEDGWLFSGRCLRVRPDKEKIDPGYLSWFFGLPGFKNHIRQIAVGATMPSLNTAILRDVAVFYPPSLKAQQAIACILEALNDKIELNRQMNQTLEELAGAIFKSWFVDFDPVSAKAEGRDTGLPVAIADLFPDEFEESDAGEIPRGWKLATLAEVSEKPQYGYTAAAADGRVGPKFLRITDINKQPWINWRTVPYCTITPEEQRKYRLREGDILIARMADPGHGVLVEDDIDAVFASYLIRFRPIHKRLRRYLQYWLRSDSYWNLVRARQAGTTRSSLNAQVLGGFSLLLPNSAVLELFSAQVGALRSGTVANVAEMGTLGDLRDSLMPKLISGELSVPDADRIVGRAI